MLFEIFPTFPKEGFIYLNELNGGTFQEACADFHSLNMPISAVEKCDHFIKHKGGSDQRWTRANEVLPMIFRRYVVFVVGCLKGDEVARIDEKGVDIHEEVP